ncbi:MAG TPA: Yip1 family protein [Candidatus Methanofastidiosa archaeon]|nr:Yip1 family protein [Candidatus Methanofastidiosa archaeon]
MWLMALATDILGKYEYKEEFLIIAFALWVFGSFVGGFETRREIRKNLSSAFRKAGTTLFGIWIILLIFNWIGWLGPIWEGKVNFTLGISLITFAISFTVRATTIKNTNWRVRSTFYSLGFLIVLSWILMKVFDIFIKYQDATILVGIAALAVGYIIGASKKTHDYDIFEEKVENISKVMDEVRDVPRAAGPIKVLQKDLILGSIAKLKVRKGAIFVDMERDGEKCGKVFFGEGNYKITSNYFSKKQNFIGMCHAKGNDCSDPNTDHRMATEEDLEGLGLEKDDIMELSNIFVKGEKNSSMKLEDLKIMITKGKKKTEIDLPFFKVLEGVDGDYVKFGSIEIADLKGKGSHIKIGGKEYIDKDNGFESLESYPFAFDILTTEGSTYLGFSDENVLLESSELYYKKKGSDETVKCGDLEFTKADERERLNTDDIEMYINNRYFLRYMSRKFELSVEDSHISYEFGNKTLEIDDPETSRVIKDVMRQSMPHIVKDLMDDSKVLLNEFIMQVTGELEG